ncbi:MAG: transcriptional regulator [Oleibacter sp.]|nr:transcriptional regulator [Thalassolituus sp.]
MSDFAQSSTPISAAQLLGLMDSGVLILDHELFISAANADACSILGQDLDAILDTSFLQQEAVMPGWMPLFNLLRSGQSGDISLKTVDDKALLVSVRYNQQENNTRFTSVIFHDLEVFEYRRDRASGRKSRPAFLSLADNKARPDYSTQRLIAPELDRALARGERALLQGVRVLITGESGVGKTEIARYLHTYVSDNSAPFQAVNCASIPDSLFESEMFGYDKGAFTGALQTGKPGFIEQAEGGTLFLDEVGEIPLASQAKLLSFLEEGIFRRVGGEQDRMVKVRIITATNRDLKQMTLNGEFRADLYYRLAVVSLNIPPLRGNKRLISHMTDRFIDTLNKRRREPFILPQFVRDRLMHYHWPGNVRELVNITQQLAIFADETVDYMQLMDELMPPFSAPANSPDNELFNESILPARHLKDMVRIYEKSIIDEAINTYGSKRAAARALGVDIGTIVRKTNNEKLN